MQQSTWIKTTKAIKQEWMMAEEGSFEDSGRNSSHAYNEIRGSYWASMYIDKKNIDTLVSSLMTSTFADMAPRKHKTIADRMIVACEEMGRTDLANEVKANA